MPSADPSSSALNWRPASGPPGSVTSVVHRSGQEGNDGAYPFAPQDAVSDLIRRLARTSAFCAEKRACLVAFQGWAWRARRTARRMLRSNGAVAISMGNGGRWWRVPLGFLLHLYAAVLVIRDASALLVLADGLGALDPVEILSFSFSAERVEAIRRRVREDPFRRADRAVDDDPGDFWLRLRKDTGYPKAWEVAASYAEGCPEELKRLVT